MIRADEFQLDGRTDGILFSSQAFRRSQMVHDANDDWASNGEVVQSESQQREVADALVERLRGGDEQALAELFSLYQDRLLRLIDVRLDRKTLARVDPVDVLQDAFLDASDRVGHFFSRPDSSIAVWLRLIVLQRIQLVVRHHLLTSKRDARKEVSFGGDNGSQSFGGVAHMLADSITSPSAVVSRSEAVSMVEQLLEEMSHKDREVLILRHFEHLPNEEVAEILGISIKAASNRYVRALGRLQTLIKKVESGVVDSRGDGDVKPE